MLWVTYFDGTFCRKYYEIKLRKDALLFKLFIGEDSCGGDSGGPLMLEQKNQGRKNFTIVGTVSWGLTECGQRSMPGIYADVAYFLEWILNNIDWFNIF